MRRGERAVNFRNPLRMNMQHHIRPATESDKDAIVAVFNYFVENSFAAYPEEALGGEFYERMEARATGYPFYSVTTDDGRVVGFGLIHPYHPAPTFSRTVEITYFILTEFTGHGIGTALLSRLLEDARSLGCDTILASISSLNEQSLKFHRKHGFSECGRFQRVGKKQGRDFDVVWMQKFI